MSVIANLPFGAEAQQPTAALSRILRASVLFERLFTGLFWFLAALVVFMASALLFYTGPHLQVTNHSFELTERTSVLRGAMIVGTLPLLTKLAYAVTAAARTLPAMVIFWSLRSLFGLYAQGRVFTPANAQMIKRIGLWLVVAAVDPLACHLFLSAIGREVDHNWFHVQEVQALVLGGLVYVIAQVMQVGREIEEERSQFV